MLLLRRTSACARPAIHRELDPAADRGYESSCQSSARRAAQRSLRQQALALQPGHRFFSHTDGVVECPEPAGRFFGEDRLAGALEAHASLPLQEMKHAIASRLRSWGRDTLAHDACTFMIAEVAEWPVATIGGQN